MSDWSRPEQPVTIRSARSLGGLTFDVYLEENHEDTLTVTEHPVEQGASISDHAYKPPQTVTLRYGMSDSSPEATDGERRSQAIYEKLLELQGKREPFDLITGRRVYKNMLMTSIGAPVDAAGENALVVTIECREVIIVHAQVTSVPPRARHANGNKTGGVTDTGAKQPQPARRSALSELFG